MTEKWPMQRLAQLLDSYRHTQANGVRHLVATKTEVTLSTDIGNFCITLPVEIPGAGEPGTCALEYASSAIFYPRAGNGVLEEGTRLARQFDRVPGALRDIARDLNVLAGALDAVLGSGA